MMYGLAVAVSIAALLVVTNAQIPTVCTDQKSLVGCECCPDTDDGVCGGATRGSCGAVPDFTLDKTTTSARANWPHYYARICLCNGNYGGFDCTGCKFGYYGDDCSDYQVLPRKPVRDLDDAGWTTFNKILLDTKTHLSGYSVPLAEAVPGTYPLQTVELSIFDFLVWSHHYAAKDAGLQVDYAHGGPGFFTWHRLMNLNFEEMIQCMLKDQGDLGYHNFRLPYWDWRAEMQNSAIGLSSDQLFTASRMGETVNANGFPHVQGGIFDNNAFDTLCYNKPFVVCDPRDSTGPLQRCPFNGRDPCKSDNPDWPVQREVEHILAQPFYDYPPYNTFSSAGFRNFVDVNVSNDYSSCGSDRMCVCFTTTSLLPDVTCPANSVVALDFKLHSVVHLIVGLGDQESTVPVDKRGHMDDVAASPNDPMFYIHHTMADCIFETWRTANPDAQYPVSFDPSQFPIADGHKKDDYSRGWLPLYKNNELFAQAENFGYTCVLADIPTTSSSN